MKNYCFKRWLLAALILAVPACWAQLPGECQGIKSTDKPQILQQKLALEEKLNMVQAEPETPGKVDQLQAIQSDLIGAIFKLDCFTQVALAPVHAFRGPTLQGEIPNRFPSRGAARPTLGGCDACASIGTVRPERSARATSDSTESRFVDGTTLVKVFFSTDRNVAGRVGRVSSFGSNSAPNVTWGSAEVSVPVTRLKGEMATPPGFKEGFDADRQRYFVIMDATPYDHRSAFVQELQKSITDKGTSSLLLFVHGYNVTFQQAAMRAAQLVTDLDFKGTTVLYSWPSAGEYLSYGHDEDAVRLAETGYGELLNSLAELPFTPIFLLAHSMGTRLVTEVANKRVLAGIKTPAIKELLLAAADLNQDIFRRQIEPNMKGPGQPRTTIYASGQDVAMAASKRFHDFVRLGDASKPIYRASPFETIDVSDVAPRARSAGHSYLFDSPRVMDDVAKLLFKDEGAASRSTLRAVEGETPMYWKVK